ncbi:MAG: SGNH/GDSL hydrolase family protein [Bacteroidia bacterium]
MSFINKYFPLNMAVVKQEISLFDADRLKHFLISLFQFLLVFYIVIQYNIERSFGVIEYAPFVIAAFILYSFIPLRFRPFSLIIICFALIYSAFGLLAGSFIIAVGLGMILICHLPLKFNLRLFIILGTAFILAVCRTEIFYIPWMTMSVMYMAPMFMFRLIIYMYELKHGLVPVSRLQSIAYFFLFPNIFFLFFPIVDYKTYIKTYYNIAEKEVWQKGIRWMLRGLVHLMCYRLICFNFLIEPSDIMDLSSLLHYMIANYSLIIRLSGVFHFAVGMLCMFGLNLPPVFDNYFIATSFVDLWRRINIYWRDFVLKIFFYPIMFRYKKVVKKNLLPLTMMTVFIITWLLHSYQLFWITGVVLIKPIDIIFWIVIGACITVNSMIIEKEALAGKSNTETRNTIASYFITMIKIQGMIFFMSLMWSLWSSRSLEDWRYILSKAKHISSGQVIEIAGIIIAVTILGVMVQLIIKNQGIKKLIGKKPQDTLFLTLPSLILLALFSFKSVTAKLPSSAQKIILNMNNSSPNAIEKTNADIGYYDRLIEGDEDMTIGIGAKSFKKLVRKNPYTDAYYITNDIMHRRMKPNLKIDGIDHNFQSNSFGIRDKEYSVVKPPGTTRIALLGGSYEMGSGVDNDQVFESIVEEKLNKERVGKDHGQIEIFNFAGGGYYLLQHVELANTTIFKYHPDGVIYFAHSDERGKVIKDFTNAIKLKLPLKYPFLEHIQEISGVKSYMSALQIKELLTPYADTIIKWGYHEIAERCKENNAVPIWAYLPTTTESVDVNEYNEIKSYAETLGFVTLDMRDAYGNVDRKLIQISEWNTHPNVLGHRLIATRFYRELLKNQSRIFLNNK